MRKNSGYQRPSLVSAFCARYSRPGRLPRRGYRLRNALAVRVAGQNDTTTITGRQIDRSSGYIRVSRLANACRPIIQYYEPGCRNLLTILLRSWSYCPYCACQRMTAAVTSKLISVTAGRFSSRRTLPGHNADAVTRTNQNEHHHKERGFQREPDDGGNNGPCQPPKNSVTINAERSQSRCTHPRRTDRTSYRNINVVTIRQFLLGFRLVKRVTVHTATPAMAKVIKPKNCGITSTHAPGC